MGGHGCRWFGAGMVYCYRSVSVILKLILGYILLMYTLSFFRFVPTDSVLAKRFAYTMLCDHSIFFRQSFLHLPTSSQFDTALRPLYVNAKVSTRDDECGLVVGR